MAFLFLTVSTSLLHKDQSLPNSILGNRPQLEALLGSMQQLAEDVSDPSSQKAAFQFLGRCLTAWVQPIQPDMSNGQQSMGLPGFERFVYERLIPTAFSVLASPLGACISDASMLMIPEIGIMH